MSINNYLKETKAELSHVNWPTKKQSIVFSLVVVIISVLVALFLGLFDFLFSKILNLFI
ncbi:MAG: preprotein translocase subunit SecE [Parcubacteria group bacterium]|nr:preprotein translocase subunit SecE [Parcubacteria group bacterium]